MSIMLKVTWLARGRTWLLCGSVSEELSCFSCPALRSFGSGGAPLTCPHRQGSLVLDGDGFLCSNLDRLCLLHLHCRFLVLTQEGKGAEGLFSLLILRHSLWLGNSK